VNYIKSKISNGISEGINSKNGRINEYLLSE
jgi:transposase